MSWWSLHRQLVDFFLLTFWHSEAPPSLPFAPPVGSESPRYKRQNAHISISGSCRTQCLSVCLRTGKEKSVLSNIMVIFFKEKRPPTVHLYWFLVFPTWVWRTDELEGRVSFWGSPVLLPAGGVGGGALGVWEGESSRLWSDKRTETTSQCWH